MAGSMLPTDLMDDCLPPGAVDVAREAGPPPGPRTASRVTAVILVFATLYFAKAFFVPVAMALILYILLMPMVRSLSRRGAPRAVAAGVVMTLGVTALGLSAYELASPARNWLMSTPAAVSTAARKWHALAMPLEKVSNAADRIAEETAVGGTPRTSTVVLQGPSLSSRLFGTTESLLAAALEVVILLYALLLVGDRLLLRVVHAIPRCRDRQRVITIARAAEALISRYLFLTAAINICEGALVAVAMATLGMPTPVLWGVFVAVAEFVPYIGMITMTGVLAITGLAYFDSLSHALLVPASYLVINFIQGNIVSPLVISRRLTLNPVAIFLSLALWWWLWGVAGAFLAVPMLAALKICCDHVDSLAAVGALLGDPSLPEPVAPAPAVVQGSDSVSLVA